MTFITARASCSGLSLPRLVRGLAVVTVAAGLLVAAHAAHAAGVGDFFASARTGSQSAAAGLRYLASGAGQRLWISITGISSGEA